MSSGPAPSDGGGVMGWMKRHKVWTGVIAFVLFVGVVGAFSDDETTDAPEATERSTQSEGATSPKQTADTGGSGKTADSTEKKPAEAKPASSEFGTYGPLQTKFVDAALQGRADYENADNELQEGAAINQRNQKMCDFLGDARVEGWQGKVITLDSNGDGYGVVELEIADDIKVATWNNAFSDIADGTLIKPGPLYDTIITLKEGDIVSFSGQFMDSGDACVNDSALTKRGGATSPDFIFKFSDIAKLN